MRRAGEQEWLPASVPGSVYGDLLANGRMEDPFWKDNEDKALSLMEYDYEYVTQFDCPEEIRESDRALLHFDGLDTIADVYLNGEHLGNAYSMHRIWEYDVKGKVRPADNELKVVLHSPTKFIRQAFQECRTLGNDDTLEGFVHIRKAHYMSGWDWGAHLPDAGIFRPVTLLGIDRGRIDNVLILQEHERVPEADSDAALRAWQPLRQRGGLEASGDRGNCGHHRRGAEADGCDRGPVFLWLRPAYELYGGNHGA